MLLSIEQFAKRAGVHPDTLRRWLRAGENLPAPAPIRLAGGARLWREQDVDQWRAALLRPAEQESPSPRSSPSHKTKRRFLVGASGFEPPTSAV
ncbi:MAG: helix-turn-helix domain-containing protein [Actinomycetota bacterium]